MKQYLAGFALLTAAGVAVAATLPQDPETAIPEEMKLFDDADGVWDGQLTMWSMGQEIGPSPCTENVTHVLGGQWVESNFEMEYMGLPFTGKVLMGWDALNKKYINIWINSFGGTPSITHGSYDSAKKQMEFVGTGEGMTGEMAKIRVVNEMPDADHRSMTTYEIAEDGTETKTTVIEYTRRKRG